MWVKLIIASCMNLFKRFLGWGAFRAPDPKRISAREEWYRQHLGAYKGVFHPTDSTMPHIDVYAMPPREGRDFWTYITGGISDETQMQSDQNAPERTEILLYMQERSDWAAELLQMIALYPFRFGEGLDVFHTIDIGEPVLKESTLESVLMTPCDNEDEAFNSILLQGERVVFLTMIFITKTERAFAIEHSSQELYELLKKSIGLIHTDLSRKSVVDFRVNRDEG